MSRSAFWLAFCALAIVAGSSAAAAEPHPFNVHDLVAMERLSDPQVSPDGSRVVFTLRSTDLEANRGRTDLWLVGVDGSGLRRLTSHPENDWGARWAPDGQWIYFLSTRKDSSQVWKIAPDGGEATQVTDFPLDVDNLVVAPTGKHLAVSAEVFPDCDTMACTAERAKKKEEEKASGRLYDRLFARHWDTWKDGRRAHLWVVPVAGGDPVDVTRDMDADIPSKPFGGAEEYAFTPDGQGVVFTARVAGREEPWSTDFDLYSAPIDGSAAPTCLTDANSAWDTQPVFSPDGKTLAYLAMARAGYEADRFRIVLREWPDGEPRILTEGWDRSPHGISWSAAGETIWTTAEDVGQGSLFAIEVATGKARVVANDGSLDSPQPVAGDRVLFARHHLRSPVDLYTVRSDGSDPRQLTEVNRERLTDVLFGQPEQMSFRGWNGETVWAWIVKPVGFDSAKKYPVAFLIHGGPQGSFGNDFHYRWNPQAYAGRGYAAVMIDFHGSTGYGQAFTDSIRGDWGGKPLVDLQKGLEAALRAYPWMDGERVCALGASFGGFMINWIAGNWAEPFRCLVNHDGNLDERMAYFDTEELWFPEWDHQGTPWGNSAGFAKHNPIDHVGKWKTPMLVVHSGKDYRVVDTQGLSTFTALQRRGIPSKLLYFPDENHWVLKPANSVLWHETVLGWLDQWTAEKAP